MIKRKVYESPSIERTQVEMEDSLCAASIIDTKIDKGVKTEGHEVGVELDASEWGVDDWK